MAGIKLLTTFNNDNLVPATSLGASIASAATLVGWFQADTQHAILDGNDINYFTDLGGGDGRFTRLASNSMAVLETDQIAGYSAAKFNGGTIESATPDGYVFSGATLDTDAAYTYVALFKPADNVNGDTIISRFSGVDDRAILNMPNGAGVLRYQHGSGDGTAHPITPGEWCLVIAAYDGSASAKLYADGITYPSVSTSGTSGSSNLYLGVLNDQLSQAFDGHLSDVMLFSEDLFANPTRLAEIKNYFQTVYGVAT